MPSNQPDLGSLLRARRRARRLSLRDLASEIGVSFNTLSRVERGHIPDLEKYRRIAAWLDVPIETLANPQDSTPAAIAHHLRADEKLSSAGAEEIARLVREMYDRLTAEQPRVAVHLRSAQTFTPAAGGLLNEILKEMQTKLLAGE